MGPRPDFLGFNNFLALKTLNKVALVHARLIGLVRGPVVLVLLADIIIGPGVECFIDVLQVKLSDYISFPSFRGLDIFSHYPLKIFAFILVSPI